MFNVTVMFEQNGRWSKEYHYLSTKPISGHVVVPTGSYMTCAYVTSCNPVPPGVTPHGLKYVYGLVNYDLLPPN